MRGELKPWVFEDASWQNKEPETRAMRVVY